MASLLLEVFMMPNQFLVLYAGYARRGFTLFQHHVDREIIRELRDDAPLDSVNVRMQLFPYPPYIDDPFIGMLMNVWNLHFEFVLAS